MSVDFKILKWVECYLLVSDVDWLVFHVCHAEFGKYIAECPLKITNTVDTDNVNKLCNEQILISKSKLIPTLIHLQQRKD